MALRAALLLLLLAAVAAESPVEKVIGLLEELKTEVTDEGKAEAKTYDEFACFCKDTTKDKSDAIKATQDTIEELAATMQEKSDGSKEKAEKIIKLTTALENINKELQHITAMREAEKTKYEAHNADLTKAIDELTKATEDAKSGMTSFSQMSNTAKKSLLVADALDIAPKEHRALSAFLQSAQMGGEDPEEGDNFHSRDLIETFESLTKTFTAKRDEVIKVEEKNKKDYEKMMETKTKEKTTTAESKAFNEEDKATLDTELGEATDSIVENEGIMKDDQAYLKDLTKRCELEAQTWDQRSKTRADEVTALTKALDIITSKVKDNHDATVPAMVQKSSGPVGDAKDELSAPSVQARNNLEESDIGDVGLDFFQASSPRAQLRGIRRLAQDAVHAVSEERRQRALAALVQEGQRLKSQPLVALAMKINADPFLKVKKMVQNLIEKLNEQAYDEETKKGWCDGEIGKAQNNRDSTMAKIMSINAELTQAEADKAANEESIATLTSEIADLNAEILKQTKLRNDEKAENMDTLEKAKEGLAACKDAYDVLEAFYKGANKGKVALVQTKVQTKDPEAMGGQAYKGNQAKGGGILDMLNVIIHDFKTAIKTVEKDERSAAREFTKFMQTSQTSIAAKETSKTQAEFGLKEADRTNTESLLDLDKHQKILDSILEEREDLKPACTDAGTSYEERKEKRNDEISALKKAMCELDPKKADEECKTEEKPPE